MQFTQRQRLLTGRWRPLLAAIAVGLLLGFAGPFGTYPAFPTATRYAFWLGMTAAGVVAALAAEALLPRKKLRSGAIRIGAVALVSAVPMTFVVAWAMTLVQPGRIYTPQQLLALFWGVAAVQLLVVYATTATAPAVDQVPEPAQASVIEGSGTEAIAASFPSALLRRLPPGIGTDIIALETEDHYLRVHAVGGSALILMRMADAVAMLDPPLGMQVHRRWWVAHDAISEIVRSEQRSQLKLRNGLVVPVGRTYSAAVRSRSARLPLAG